MLSWIYLLLVICCDVAGTVCMKISHGFTKFPFSLLAFVFYGLCVVFLTYSVKRIDLSVAYTVWAGVGTALVAIISILYFDEAMTLIKLISLIFIIIGVIGLNLHGHD